MTISNSEILGLKNFRARISEFLSGRDPHNFEPRTWLFFLFFVPYIHLPQNKTPGHCS